MRVFTFTEARQRLSELLDLARTEEVLIKRKSGETFSLCARPNDTSPFDVPAVETKATTEDILDAIAESRSRHD